MDFATRAYNHGFRLDPIVRSLLDIDFYKLLMMQFIWTLFPHITVTFALKNRTKSIKLTDDIAVADLTVQLDHVRTLRFLPSELVWLRGQTFYGQTGIFTQGFIDTLKHFSLPNYCITLDESGNLDLSFTGTWWEVTLWEIYAMTIVNELRYRKLMATMSKSELDIMYARAKVKLYAKLKRLAELPNLNFTDFGTRRRHSFLWQEHCVLTAQEVLGDKMTGTSNVYLAMKHNLEPKGTNAHELPMVFAALAMDDEALKASQYAVLKHWQTMYNGNLLVFLPDTFGTAQFLKDAPDWIRYWKGARPDSKEPFEAGEELIKFWKRFHTEEEIAKNKLIIFSDGLDVNLHGKENGSNIIDIYNRFDGRVQIGFGMGTNFTNDFLDCHPKDDSRMKPISLVCKVKSADNKPAVKLSDNAAKRTGPVDEIARYVKVFGSEGVSNAETLV